MDWGVAERRREKEREVVRKAGMGVGTGPGMRRSVGYHKSQVWTSAAAATTVVEAVIEEEEEDEEDDAVVSPETKTLTRVEQIISQTQSEPTSENGMVVDPSEYLFAHAEAEEEAEEAWFEEHWKDLQAETPVHSHSHSHAQAVPFSAATTDVSVQIYSVDSESDSESCHPSLHTQFLPEIPATMPMEISPPPSPKLSPTRLQDKLESPMEFGTMPARLESAIGWAEFESVWEVRGLGEMFVGSEDVNISAVVATVYAEEEDVPVLETDEDELGEESEIDEEEENDDELLITPGEETLDEFGVGSFGSEPGMEMEEMRLIGVKGKA